MSLIIKSELSKKFLLEEDAIQGFKKAVANNQLLLAMQVLTEIIDTFMKAFDSMIDSPESESVDAEATPVAEEPKQKPKKDKNQNEQK